MGNRITYNSTTKRHLLTPLLFYFLSYLLSPSLCAKELFINVYLKLNSTNQIAPLINHFNQFLAEHHLIQDYKIKPFLNERPLHITLYLSHYKENKTSELIKRVKNLAQQERTLKIQTALLQTSPSAYVMLTVKESAELQELSNKAVQRLANLHAPNAEIPSWAAQDVKRASLFKQYGSPSVFELFNPHFSIMDPKHLNQKQQKDLVAQLQQLLPQFMQMNKRAKTAKAVALGVGIADNQGQIIKELASFALMN